MRGSRRRGRLSAAFPPRDVHLHSARPLRVRIEGGASATLGSLRQLAQGIENGLMWLPIAGEVGSSGTAVPPAASTRKIVDECARRGFQVLAVRSCEEGPMTRCLLVHRFDSAKVIRRVTAAIENVVRTMGQDWRMV